jgi:hypothetical protein
VFVGRQGGAGKPCKNLILLIFDISIWVASLKLLYHFFAATFVKFHISFLNFFKLKLKQKLNT